jgi:hypothetical protein
MPGCCKPRMVSVACSRLRSKTPRKRNLHPESDSDSVPDQAAHMPTSQQRAEGFVHNRIQTPAPEHQRDAAGGMSIPHFCFELIEPRYSPPP